MQDQFDSRTKSYDYVVRDMEDEIRQLNAKLDRELAWEMTDKIGTQMKQEEYLDLKLSDMTDVLSNEDAVHKIVDIFGFQEEKVKIRNEVSMYEVNKYHSCREKEKYVRVPLYASSDWNYIRFDCAGYSYEMINGMLVSYD